MLDGGCETLVSRLGVIRLVMAVMFRGYGGELLGLVLIGVLVMAALFEKVPHGSVTSPVNSVTVRGLQILNLSPMAIASDDATRICNHCDRAIPSSNIDLHSAHCSRNLEKCKVCGDMVPIKHAEEHFLNTHAPVACSLCSETIERGNLDIHKGENCPQRIVTCEFCEFPLPAIDLPEHQEVCGNRTEMCPLCNRYIRLRERYNHETRCTGIAENNLESSRDVRAAEREQGAPRGQPPEYSRRRLLFTIAITGIAVLFGSLFFEKKAETAEVH
ncbi:hypothetical protein GQ457_12G016870 [Hibiscus cannabinus]